MKFKLVALAALAVLVTAAPSLGGGMGCDFSRSSLNSNGSLPTASAISSRNYWNTNENALLRGARKAPVGAPSDISVALKSKLATNRTGNSTASWPFARP